MADTTLNATAAALLGLLHDGPMTGGQLMAEADRRLGSYWSMTRSQVYRELPALAQSGFVRLGKPGARSSQPYALTPSGRRAFARWLAEDTGRESIRNPVALRAAFGDLQSPNSLAATYANATEYHTMALAEVRESVKVMKKDGESFAAAAQEFAIGYHKAALAWLRSAPVR